MARPLNIPGGANLAGFFSSYIFFIINFFGPVQEPIAADPEEVGALKYSGFVHHRLLSGNVNISLFSYFYVVQIKSKIMISLVRMFGDQQCMAINQTKMDCLNPL